MTTESRAIIGCMTGTSIDGLDAAVVVIDGHGIGMRATLIAHVAMSLGACREGLSALASQVPMTAGSISQLAHEFGELHLQACREVWRVACERHPLPSRPWLISVHGQTIWHRPPQSWQLFQPAPLSRGMDCPVVCDLRQADLAAGGQGAPLTPLADYILFASDHRERTVVNFGGFCNITHLPRRQQAAKGEVAADPRLRIRGGDLCPCNHLLDEIARRGLGVPFDADGQAALRGTPSKALVTECRSLLMATRAEARSLGTGDECHAWIERALKTHPAADVAATASEVLAEVVSAAVPPQSSAMCFGGGTHHRRLMASLHRWLGPDRLRLPTMPPEAREAACWAVLGAFAADGEEIAIPAITQPGGPARIAGLWTR